MKNLDGINILLASPGNMKADRTKVSEIVDNINKDSGRRAGFHAEVVSWETHSRPAAGEYAQGVINEQFPDDIDIFVGLMGTKFGTPTKHWGSGTEEEFELAYAKWKSDKSPEIMFYFSNASMSVNDIDVEQLKKRNKFRRRLGKRGVYYFEYEDVISFQMNMYRHISDSIHNVLQTKDVSQSQIVSPDESDDSLRSYHALLANDSLANANTLINLAAH